MQRSAICSEVDFPSHCEAVWTFVWTQTPNWLVINMLLLSLLTMLMTIIYLVNYIFMIIIANLIQLMIFYKSAKKTFRDRGKIS